MMEGMGREHKAEENTRDHLVHHASTRQDLLFFSFLTHLANDSTSFRLLL